MDKASPLTSVAATRAVLEAHGLATKHALGQNFLINDGIVAHICELADLGPDDIVLEVGPGIGTLSLALLPRVKHVIAIERDADLPAVLADTCADYADRFTLRSMDALKLEERDFGGLTPTKFISNLPYAVAATLILDYFQRFPSIQQATVMVQAEVADRICASIGVKDYGAYTVKLGLYAQPSGRFSVGPGNFFPPPRVDSSVIRLDRIAATLNGTPLTPEQLRATCLMADAAFANRRKTISNSCKTYFAGRGATGKAVIELLPALFEQVGIDPRRRGETLTRDEFMELGCRLVAALDVRDILIR